MSLTLEQREAIVRAAKEWMGTPYHHQARVKGAGADCAMFPLAVYQECGLLPADFHPPEYSMQWHLHRSEEMYLQTIEPFVKERTPCECVCHHGVRDGVCSCGNGWECKGNPVQPYPADFVVWKFGRTFSHGAIVIAWPLVIHSYIPHGVTLADASTDAQLIGREYKVFEVRKSASSA